MDISVPFPFPPPLLLRWLRANFAAPASRRASMLVSGDPASPRRLVMGGACCCCCCDGDAEDAFCTCFNGDGLFAAGFFRLRLTARDEEILSVRSTRDDAKTGCWDDASKLPGLWARASAPRASSRVMEGGGGGMMLRVLDSGR